MSPARERLAALAAAAGYDRDALALIADAALPAHRPGERLDDAAIAHLCTAVEILAQCGHHAEVLADLIVSYRVRHRDGSWRTRFWRAQLGIAALRYRHPRFYGLSPCEADPSRLERAQPSRCSLPSASLAA